MRADVDPSADVQDGQTIMTPGVRPESVLASREGLIASRLNGLFCYVTYLAGRLAR
jgi:hypothetical protein